MSDAFDHSSLPDDELLAAEYALGVLSGAERSAAEQRVARDHGFARLVAEWEQRLAPWAAEIADVVPPPQVWDRDCGRPARANAATAACGKASPSGADFALRPASLAAACLAALIYLGALTQPQPLVATIEGGGQPSFRRHHRHEARHRRRRAGRLQCRRHARAGTVADPAPTASRARSACCAPTAPVTHHPSRRTCRASRRRRRAGGLAGAARRLAHRPADRPGDRQPASSRTCERAASLRRAPP